MLINIVLILAIYLSAALVYLKIMLNLETSNRFVSFLMNLLGLVFLPIQLIYSLFINIFLALELYAFKRHNDK